MTNYDDTFELVAGSLRALTGGEFDELLARATHVARNAICITDAELDAPGPRIIYVNPAFEQMTGYTADEVHGRDPRFLQGPETDRTVLARLRADLESGRTFQGETFNYRKDGTPFRMAWRIAAVRDAEGRTTHYVAAQDDVTAIREAEQLLRDHADYLQADTDWLGSLVDLGVSMARTSGPDAVLAQVLRAAVGPLGADGAAFVLVDDDRGDWVATHTSGFDATDGDRFLPQAATLVDRSLATGRPVVQTMATEPVGAGTGYEGGAVAVLPIGGTDGPAYGVLVLGWRTPRAFRVAERSHLEMLARLTTMTHRKTQALENQRSLAVELQGALLPELHAVDGLEVAWRYLSVADDSVVGGDWYDVVRLPDGHAAAFVGDVVGHGATAAALMGEIRYTIRGLLRAFTEPGPLLDELDATLLADHAPGDALATVLATTIAPDGTVRYSAAGHPHPVVRRADGRVDVLDGARSRLVGASSGGDRPTATTHLGEGDCLLAFSDGVFESRDLGYDDAYRDLVARVAAADDDPDALCEAALDVGEEGPVFRDDVVVLAVRRRRSDDRAGPGRPVPDPEGTDR